MKGSNLILMNQASIMEAVEYYLNTVMLKDDAKIEVTGFVPRYSGQDQGLFEVQVQPAGDLKNA